MPHRGRPGRGAPAPRLDERIGERGVSEVLLCARCDAGHPLVASFAPPYDPDRFVRALTAWIAGALPPQPDESALRAEADAWRRGEL
ncbi:DUF6300 family protein [Nonomuraea sp. CA-218870]|uniref:DUF6300 family protein n=1 Tax=Nonomuraea sp. CA-218870 TaxID=3239998 RepID=UPI003D911754